MPANFGKIAKLNSKDIIFWISFLTSGISKTIQNYEKICTPLILNHIIANKTRYLCVKRVWGHQRLEDVKIVVNHFACKHLQEFCR